MPACRTTIETFVINVTICYQFINLPDKCRLNVSVELHNKEDGRNKEQSLSVEFECVHFNAVILLTISVSRFLKQVNNKIEFYNPLLFLNILLKFEDG